MTIADPGRIVAIQDEYLVHSSFCSWTSYLHHLHYGCYFNVHLGYQMCFDCLIIVHYHDFWHLHYLDHDQALSHLCWSDKANSSSIDYVNRLHYYSWNNYPYWIKLDAIAGKFGRWYPYAKELDHLLDPLLNFCLSDNLCFLNDDLHDRAHQSVETYFHYDHFTSTIVLLSLLDFLKFRVQT